jgi:hypothetical protein
MDVSSLNAAQGDRDDRYPNVVTPEDAPGGGLSLLIMNQQVAHFGHFKKLLKPHLLVILAVVLLFLGGAP